MPKMTMDPDRTRTHLDVGTNSLPKPGQRPGDRSFSTADRCLPLFDPSEYGFSPSRSTAITENLPGFGANFDNSSQQAVILEPHFYHEKVNNSPSRLTLVDGSTSQNNGKRHRSQLGITE